MYKLFLVCLALSISYNVCSQTNDQSIVSSSGDSFSNGDLNMSFTIGEPIIFTSITQYSQATNGFHQLSNLSSDLPLFVKSKSDIDIVLYPNPVEDYLFVDVNEKSIEVVTISIISLTGDLCLKSNLALNSKVNLSALKKGIYFVVFSDVDGNSILKEKIIKK